MPSICESLICSNGSSTRNNISGRNMPVMVQGPKPGYIYSPYVKISLADGKYITTGNVSQPGASSFTINVVRQSFGLTPINSYFNTAVISNFEYGFETNATGFQASFEILDSGSVAYREILQILNKTIANADNDSNRVWFDFGWIIQDENNQAKLRSVNTLTSKVLHGLPTEVQLSFENGHAKIKFKIISPLSVPHTHSKIFGKENNKMTMKDALDKLFKEVEPKINEVEYRNSNGGNFIKWLNNTEKGPFGVWNMSQQDKLNTARMWLNPYMTTNKKNVLFIYDGFSKINDLATKLIIQEDPSEPLNKSQDCCGSTIASFIINGGNDSPVISFTPNINWIFADTGAGAAAPGGSGPKSLSVQEIQEKQKKQQQSGTLIKLSTQSNMWNNIPPILHAPTLRDASNAINNMVSRNGIGRASPFEAELKIFGDPFWHSPVIGEDALIGKSFSILFVNPFTPKVPFRYIPFSGFDLYWLADPTCNTTLSNKNYMILKVNHQISNGTFVTSFKLKCLLPNADYFYNKNIGGGTNCGEEITKFAGAAKSDPANATNVK